MKKKNHFFIPYVLLLLFPISISDSGDYLPTPFVRAVHSASDIGALFLHYVFSAGDSLSNGFDFSIRSITYYKETDLATGTSSYFTRVAVARDGEMTVPVDLRLVLVDGAVIDTSWTACDTASSTRFQDGIHEGQLWEQEFDFKTSSAPEYAQLDPANKIQGDSNYFNNSLAVEGRSLPAVKWISRLFSFFQNLLLSSGVIA